MASVVIGVLTDQVHTSRCEVGADVALSPEQFCKTIQYLLFHFVVSFSFWCVVFVVSFCVLCVVCVVCVLCVVCVVCVLCVCVFFLIFLSIIIVSRTPLCNNNIWANDNYIEVIFDFFLFFFPFCRILYLSYDF